MRDAKYVGPLSPANSASFQGIVPSYEALFRIFSFVADSRFPKGLIDQTSCILWPNREVRYRLLTMNRSLLANELVDN